MVDPAEARKEKSESEGASALILHLHGVRYHQAERGLLQNGVVLRQIIAAGDIQAVTHSSGGGHSLGSTANSRNNLVVGVLAGHEFPTVGQQSGDAIAGEGEGRVVEEAEGEAEVGGIAVGVEGGVGAEEEKEVRVGGGRERAWRWRRAVEEVVKRERRRRRDGRKRRQAGGTVR